MNLSLPFPWTAFRRSGRVAATATASGVPCGVLGILVAFLAAVVGGPTAHAATAVTFDGNGAGWVLNGGATFIDDVLTLTGGAPNQNRSVWYGDAQTVAGFEAAFVYQDVGPTGAGGMAFVVQNAAAGTAAMGTDGAGLGYGGLTPSVAVLLNTVSSAPGGRGLRLGINGVPLGDYQPTGPVDLGSGAPIEVRLLYASGVLQVRLQDGGTLEQYSVDFPLNIPGTVGATALVGITGASEGTPAEQTVKAFRYRALAPGDRIATPIRQFRGPQTYSGINVNSDGAIDEDPGLVADGGYLYGVAGRFGPVNNGTVFRVRPDGTEFQILHGFPWSEDLLVAAPEGDGPDGRVVVSGGILYGTTELGGVSGGGTVFRLNTDGTGFSVLHHFAGGAGGWEPQGLVLSGSTLYGITRTGGTDNLGTLFRIGTDGTGFQVLHHFTGADGARPSTAPTLDGSTLYGVTPGGGTGDFGTVYKIETDGTGFAVLHEFAGAAGGQWPSRGLVAAGGTLYGAASGGATDNGALYKLNTDGTGFAILWDFAGGAGGVLPTTRMVIDGAVLYGGTALGGAANKGVLYQIGTDGTGFGVLHEFAGGAGGGRAYGSPLLLGGSVFVGCIDGLWGSTGALVRIDKDGSDFGVLHHFSGWGSRSAFNQGGMRPSNPMLVANGTLFGTALEGGLSGGGTVFRLGTDGDDFTVLRNFIPGGGGGGYEPLSGLTSSGGVLYGTTSRTASAGGSIFRVNPDGSGYATLYEFNPGPDGREPRSELLVVGDTLYGTTSASATYGDRGTVFKMQTDGTGFTVLHRFLSPEFPLAPDGDAPDGSLVLIGNTLYGTTPRGGDSGFGTIYKVNTDGSGFAVVHHATGMRPSGLSLLNGVLYGLGSETPDSVHDVLYRIDPDGTDFQVLHVFNGGANGRTARGPLVHLNGAFYGTVRGGFPTDPSGVFRVNTDGTAFELLYSFSGNDRAEDGVVIHNDVIYGTSAYGGLNGRGFVFSVSTVEAPGLVVTTETDVVSPTDGLTSLREAVAYALVVGGAPVVTFSPTLTAGGPASVLLTQTGDTSAGASSIAISSPVNIEGPTGPNGITLQASGSGALRHFLVTASGSLSLANLTLTGGTTLTAGGAVSSLGSVVISGCTFSGNGSDGVGGAVHSAGSAPELVIVNSTFAGNSALGQGGAIANEAASTSIRFVTVVDNSSAGSAYWQSETTATIENCIVARNTGGDIGTSGSGGVSAQSRHNLIGTGGSGGLVHGVDGNLVGVADASLQLATLAFSGGPTPTVRVLVGSPAINAGVALVGLTTDQRGQVRDGTPDIGAFEYQPPITAGPDTVERPVTTRVVKVLKAELLADDSDLDGDPLSIISVGDALPAGATVTISGNFVVYTAPTATSGDGSFTYTLSDGVGGHTAVGSVTVTETGSDAAASAPNSVAITAAGGDVEVKFIGVPGRTYGVQYTTSSSPPYVWQEFPVPVDLVAPASGVLGHTDVNPVDPMRLYRAILRN